MSLSWLPAGIPVAYTRTNGDGLPATVIPASECGRCARIKSPRSQRTTFPPAGCSNTSRGARAAQVIPLCLMCVSSLYDCGCAGMRACVRVRASSRPPRSVRHPRGVPRPVPCRIRGLVRGRLAPPAGARVGRTRVASQQTTAEVMRGSRTNPKPGLWRSHTSSRTSSLLGSWAGTKPSFFFRNFLGWKSAVASQLERGFGVSTTYRDKTGP